MVCNKFNCFDLNIVYVISLAFSHNKKCYHNYLFGCKVSYYAGTKKNGHERGWQLLQKSVCPSSPRSLKQLNVTASPQRTWHTRYSHVDNMP